jgi:hypothetical protein
MLLERVEVNIDGGLDIPLPRMVPVRQKFDTTKLASVSEAIKKQFQRKEIAAKIKPGMTIAVGCGSRGVANVSEAAMATVAEIKKLGGKPFIFPAMGSHGAGTAEGQRQVLAGYGITEENVGCPVRATMETVELGKTSNGTPVYMDAYAAESQGVVFVCRVKPHTNFRAPIESGVVKMMTIGMGKIRGATTLHTNGMDRFIDLLPEAARLIMSKKPFLFGMAMVENAHDETMHVEAVPAETLFTREAELQAIAKQQIGRLYFDEFDVLIIEEIGKNISGAGADPNVIGRNSRGILGFEKPVISRIAMLDLTEPTHGNATGMSMGDVITLKLLNKIDFGPTYANVITATYLDGAAIPLVMNNSKEAVALAIKTVPRVKPLECRVVWIKNTLELTNIAISEALLDQVRGDKRFDVLGEPEPFRFDAAGELLPLKGLPKKVAHAG